MTNQPLSFGQKAAGVSFNPGGDPVVDQIKTDFAAIIDLLHGLRTANLNKEAVRMLSIAITEAQTAQMWAVKAVTWSHPNE